STFVLLFLFFLLLFPRPLRSTLFPYTTLFRSGERHLLDGDRRVVDPQLALDLGRLAERALDPDEDRELVGVVVRPGGAQAGDARSEEHTSELQSLRHLVCRLLLEKKKTNETPT